MHVSGSVARVLLGAALLLGAYQRPVVAQDSLPPATPPAPTEALTLRKPPSPWGGFFRSALIPGWGQLHQGRVLPAAFFLAAEAVTVAFAVQANSQLQAITDKTDPDYTRLVDKREDWLVFVGLNHLLSGTEAFIAAHLWDFPGDLALRPLPGGGTAATVTLPIRIP